MNQDSPSLHQGSQYRHDAGANDTADSTMNAVTSPGHENPPEENPPEKNRPDNDWATETPKEMTWKTWSELTVKLEGIPADTQLSQLWEWFREEGNIVWIELFRGSGREPRSSHLHHPISAKMRFKPPPRRDFWVKGQYVVRHPNLKRFPDGLVIRVLSPPFGPAQHWQRSMIHPEKVIPLQLNIPLRTLELGVSLSSQTMKLMKTIRPVAEHGIELELDTKWRNITCYFSIPAREGRWCGIRGFKFRVKVAQVKRVYLTSPDDGESCYLIIPLSTPPQYYSKNPDVKSTIATDAAIWSQQDAWNRATDVAEDIQAPLRYPISLHDRVVDPQYAEIGRWTTFRFCLDQNTDEDRRLLSQLRTCLEDFGIPCHVSPDFKVFSASKPRIWTMLDHPPVAKTYSGALALLESTSHLIHLEFPVRYQLEVCISRGMLNEHTITSEFLQKLAKLQPIKARLLLEYLVDQTKTLQDPMFLFKDPDAEAYHPSLRLPHYCALIRRAVVTPTTVRFATPNAETSNRVIRKYNHLEDRFLRVQFLEESEDFKIGKFQAQNDALYLRILRTLYQGIRIGDRKYEFLAFGSSQLKECGAYFFCPVGHTTCDEIRKWMGSFDHIKVVAKYAARLGQCFSTTREIRGITAPDTKLISDIERNGYCFSDGVGMISEFVARLVIGEMDLDIFANPTAFQFRMGGCKGVLAVWPDTKGAQVCIRESQQKFLAKIKGLEIIKCAKFATATLNRQTITLLESLGVPAISFHSLLDRQLRQFEMAMEDKNVAIELLTQFVDENQVTLIIAELLRADFRSSTWSEPFVTSILYLWRSWSLKLLKEKARIQVSQSAFVLGCVDETGSLRGHKNSTEGSREKNIGELPQIFLQLSDLKVYNKFRIVEGICLVGRNPSLHPGDIRVVQAVDEPKLRHLKDVVVFPSTGDRPVPNMLSGGDLDGDDFFVIWDPSLIPPIWNYPPMNYSGAKPKELDRDVTVDDLRNFFVSYVKSDVLPLVAHAHLGLADEHGPMSSICMELAEMHSQAVDFPKTGEPVILSQKHQPRNWPHFMEKKNPYRSNKILGQLYDKMDRQRSDFRPDWEEDFDERILKRYSLNPDALKTARSIKTQYDVAVRRLLTKNNISTEFELWTGFAMSKPTVGSDYKRQEDLGIEYDCLKQRFRDICFDAAGGHGPDKIDPFVAAMYKVTEEQIRIALFEHRRGPVNDGGQIRDGRRLDARSMPFITFPWLFPWVLIRVAKGDKYNAKDSILTNDRRRAQALYGQRVSAMGTTSSTIHEAIVTKASSSADEVHNKTSEQPLEIESHFEQLDGSVATAVNIERGTESRQQEADSSLSVSEGQLQASAHQDGYMKAPPGSSDSRSNDGTKHTLAPARKPSATAPVLQRLQTEEDAHVLTISQVSSESGSTDHQTSGAAVYIDGEEQSLRPPTEEARKNGLPDAEESDEGEGSESLMDRLAALGLED